MLDKPISNPDSKRQNPAKNEMMLSLWEWARVSSSNLKYARDLLSKVYWMADTPPTAKRIISRAYYCEANVPQAMQQCLKHVSIDPDVLSEDGWTINKSATPEGASGGPHRIGQRVLWQSFEAIIIAYVHDVNFGDLWKCLWIDDGEVFDLEAHELQGATKRWTKKFVTQKKKPKKAEKPTGKGKGNTKAKNKTTDKAKVKATEPNDDTKKHTEVAVGRSVSARFAASANFNVEGIEHSVILATTYNANARQGVFWPARVMHVSELASSQGQSKRNSAKQKISVVFLAPYWNSSSPPGSRSISFAACPLLEVDTIEVSTETIQNYPFDPKNGLNLQTLKKVFRFTGLPNSLFKRFVDSHRLALALKLFAMEELRASTSNVHPASAALFDTHAMSLKTAVFPQALLHLPLQHMLLNLPPMKEEEETSRNSNEEIIEPVIRLSCVMSSMKPPNCFGVRPNGNGSVRSDPMSSSNTPPRPPPRDPMPFIPTMPVESPGKSSVHREDLTLSNVTSVFLADTLRRLAPSELGSSVLLPLMEKYLRRVSVFLRGNASPVSIEARTKLRSLLLEAIRIKVRAHKHVFSSLSLLPEP